MGIARFLGSKGLRAEFGLRRRRYKKRSSRDQIRLETRRAHQTGITVNVPTRRRYYNIERGGRHRTDNEIPITHNTCISQTFINPRLSAGTDMYPPIKIRTCYHTVCPLYDTTSERSDHILHIHDFTILFQFLVGLSPNCWSGAMDFMLVL